MKIGKTATPIHFGDQEVEPESLSTDISITPKSSECLQRTERNGIASEKRQSAMGISLVGYSINSGNGS